MEGATPLMETVMKEGKIIADLPELADIRKRVKREMERIPEVLLSLDKYPDPPVHYSERLLALQERI